MPTEIERKFLVRGDGWRARARGPMLFEQAYLSDDPDRIVRVRIAGRRAWLTIKGRKRGRSAPEFEYAIPPRDAREMLRRLPVAGRLRKNRWRVRYEGWTWEVDEFLDGNAGLVLAEIELRRASDRPPLPDWLGREVTHDGHYSSACLARNSDAAPRRSATGVQLPSPSKTPKPVQRSARRGKAASGSAKKTV